MTESMANIVPVNGSPSGVDLATACRLLAEAKTVDEVLAIRDQAEAVRSYLKKRKESREGELDAAEIKIHAERRIGEMLKDMPGRGSHGGDRKSSCTVQLDFPRIERTLSHRCQKIHGVPESEYRLLVTRIRADETQSLSSAAVLRLAKDLERQKKRRENEALVADCAPLDECPSLGNKTFHTIVADPAWDWGDEGDVSQFGRGDPVYATYSYEQLLEMPVADLAEKDAHLYLWITNRSLPKGFALLEAWGFRYVTCLTWCKPSIGMGNYFRGSSEHVLFGVRGSQALLRNDLGTWFAAARGPRHSAKPVEFYSLVESCSPGPWLEMFARPDARRPGWSYWGAEA